MSKVMKNGRSAKNEHYVGIPHLVFDSAAFRSLSANAALAYLHLRRRYHGHNNGELIMSTRELGADMNASASSAHRALQELVSRGLIVETVKGFGRGCNRRASRWRFTDRRDDSTGALPSREFQHWTPEKKLPVPKNGVHVSPVERDVSRVEQWAR
jgi:hypothetical protein